MKKVDGLSNLTFQKIWEDNGFYQVKVTVYSDCAVVSTETYIAPAAVEELAAQLESFPTAGQEESLWENGERGNEAMPFISLKVCSKDQRGNIAMEVYLELANDGMFQGYYCGFALQTKLGQLNELGRKLLRLNQPGIGTTICLEEEL